MEDTLPTWDRVKKRATEVVSILDVLKKKYVNNIFEKYKTRWVYMMEASRSARTRLQNTDTFAPTVRHSTRKLLCAVAAMRGAAPTTLSSQAYITRVAEEVLPKPLEEYRPMHTPSGPTLLKDYEAALEARHDVDPALRISYPRKVGKMIYAMPASRVDAAFTIGVLTRWSP